MNKCLTATSIKVGSDDASTAKKVIVLMRKYVRGTGCKFPCNHAYRRKIQEYTLRIGQVLAEKGALGYFGVDFLASRTMPAAACLTNPDTWYRVSDDP